MESYQLMPGSETQPARLLPLWARPGRGLRAARPNTSAPYARRADDAMLPTSNEYPAAFEALLLPLACPIVQIPAPVRVL